MNYLVIASYLAVILLYVFVRPRWRQIGPSLLDSFEIGLFLFGSGSILVWIEGLANSEMVMRIGVLTAASGLLGAVLWSIAFRKKIAQLDFFGDARSFVADPADRFVISAGLVVSSLVSVIMLIAVFRHDHIRSLLLDAVFRNAGTLNDARIIMSSGSEGYFAPGYVKQFRDIIVPILCCAAVLFGKTYWPRSLVFLALVIALAGVFISGQRLTVVQYFLCFCTVVLIGQFSPRYDRKSLYASVALLLVLFCALAAMTVLLGRLNTRVFDLPVGQIDKIRHEFVYFEDLKRAEVLKQIEVVKEKVKAAEASGTPSELDQARTELSDIEYQAVAMEREITKVRNGAMPSSYTGPLASGTTGFASILSSSVVQIPLTLVQRAVVAVPRENTVAFPAWHDQPHAAGSGWLQDMGGIRFGTQKQLSNDLAIANHSSAMGNSPLGLPTDVFYNWGWAGVMIVPALFALAFLWLDIALVASRSALTSAAKIFMFFSIPTMYSPFMFILYGGFVAIGILAYVRLRQNGVFSFIGIRPPARQVG